ncbi:MAG: PDDEXK nuclease domain-containing protein, partial [Zoogloeaceae bacterium]|nr:PDDEXK nuclease domain-containing protein [Zoogloeaceae bacterium]
MNEKSVVQGMPGDYAPWLADIKRRIAVARQRAALAVNAELILLYWRIGRDILQRQSAQGWGSKVIERLARDLREAFPDMKGFSRANLLYMRAFAEAWDDAEIVQQVVGQLPWGHNVLLLTRLKDPALRLRYAEQARAEGWSRATLERNIRNRLHARQGQAVTNFDARLPAPHSALAQETLKDPYLFDFLGLGDDAHEREIENALVRHITHFLLE